MILFSWPSVLSFIPICVLFLFCIFSATFIFPHFSFFFLMSHFWLRTYCPLPSNRCCFLSTHLPRSLSPFWRIVSTHERAQWSDQLAISSHKSIDLIPWRRDLHLPLHCSALSVCLKLGCVCDRCKGIVCPKIHQFAIQYFVNTGSSDISKSA